VPNPPQPNNGYTLFCHTYENPSTARDGLAHMYLIDMEGRPVYEWTARTAVQLLELLPDGTLCYSTRDRSNIDQAGLYRIGPDSSVLWHYHCRVDHDFHVMDKGHLMIHCLMDRMVPQLGPGLRRNSYIVEIGPNEELLWEWHGEAHIEELVDLCGLETPINCFDWAHNNTCEVLPDNSSAARDPRFRAGNILFSYRSLDIVGVIDRQSSAIVWAWGPGELDGQHQPTMLANGHILIYVGLESSNSTLSPGASCGSTWPRRGAASTVPTSPVPSACQTATPSSARGTPGGSWGSCHGSLR
jgi:hypothetical protein